MHRSVYILLSLALLLGACKRGGYYQDAEIDNDLSTRLDTLNQKLVHLIAAKNVDSFLALCGENVQARSGTRDGIRELIGSLGETACRRPYTTQHRFYARYPDEGRTIILQTGEKGDHDYAIKYTSPTRWSYATVQYFEDSLQTFSLLTIWCSYNGEWKLLTARSAPVKIFGSDAVDWYYRAKQRYADNDLVDAANCMHICGFVIQPANQIWQYHEYENMTALIEQIKSTAERDYTFPIQMSQVETHPQILATSVTILATGYYPAITYITSLPMADTALLSRECDSVNAHIGAVFNDIDHYNKTLFYRVQSRIPRDSTDEVPYHDFSRPSAATWHY